jgi:hypothetical protein
MHIFNGALLLVCGKYGWVNEYNKVRTRANRTGKRTNVISYSVIGWPGMPSTRKRGPISAIDDIKQCLTNMLLNSSHSKLTTLFKPAGGVFSHISTGVPRQSANEDITASRISHGSMMSSGKRLMF